MPKNTYVNKSALRNARLVMKLTKCDVKIKSNKKILIL